MTEQSFQTVALVAASLLSATTWAAAQDGGGVLATLDVSNGVSYETSSTDGDTTRLGTTLTFGVSQQTRSQSFAAFVGGQVLLRDGEVAFDNRTAGLSYSYTLRRSEIALRFDFSDIDVTGGTLVDDVIVNDLGQVTGLSLVADEGTRQSLGGQVSLTTGQGGPFGTETVLRYQRVDYQGLISGDYDDSETWQARTALRFDVTSQVTLRLTGQYIDTQEDDAVNTARRTARVGVGAAFEIDPVWSADVSLRFSQIATETDTATGRSTDTRDGIDVGLDVTREFRNGEMRLSYARELTEVGSQDRLVLSRALALGNGADLTVGVGALYFEGADEGAFPILELDYAQETRRGALSLSLEQGARIADDTPAVRTTLAAGYRHQLSEISTLSVNGSYVAQDIVGRGTGDQQSVEIGLGYSHALTEDWSLSTRVAHRMITETGAADRDISTLSLSLERQFSFRP